MTNNLTLSARKPQKTKDERRRHPPGKKDNAPDPKMKAVMRVPGEPFKLSTLPSELQLHVMTCLNAIDATCLGLTSKHFYKLYRAVFPLVPALTVGSPSSSTPVVKRTGCKYCVPVLWYPAHCELRNHLSKWMPPDLEYCMNCKLFTQSSPYSERSPWRRFCGKCGEDFGSQLSICRERLQETQPGETRWPRYYGERYPPSDEAA